MEFLGYFIVWRSPTDPLARTYHTTKLMPFKHKFILCIYYICCVHSCACLCHFYFSMLSAHILYRTCVCVFWGLVLNLHFSHLILALHGFVHLFPFFGFVRILSLFMCGFRPKSNNYHTHNTSYKNMKRILFHQRNEQISMKIFFLFY